LSVDDEPVQVRSASQGSALPGFSPALVRGLWVGIFGVGVLTLIKLHFHESIGEPSPFLLYFVAVLLGAWYGGRAAGLLMTVVCALIGGVMFIPDPLLDLWTRTLPQISLFAIEGIAISLITARLADERKRALSLAGEVSSSGAQLDVVLSNVDEGITLVDRQGAIVYANRQAATLCGYPSPEALYRAGPSEILARFELLDERGAPFPPDLLPGRMLLEGRVPPERLVRFRSVADGSERWSSVRASAVRDEQGAIRFIVNMFRDVSEVRRQRAELQLSRDWLATALRSIGDAVIATDADGRAMFMNPVAEQLTGWLSEEANGRLPAEIFPIVHEETRAPVESPVERVLREGVVVGMTNHTVLIRRDGSEIAIDDSAAPIRGEDGKLSGVVLVFRDVSASRRAALEHERLFAHVEHAREEAVRANRAKDEFLAMLGHELRNPLAPILTTLELMRMRSPTTFAHERGVIERQLAYVVRLVDDLLDVSRITEGRIELYKTRIEIADVIEHAIEMSRPLVEQRKHELTVSVERDLFVSADRSRLAQVVSNLLTNAAKYTEPGGHIAVSAAREPVPNGGAARVVIRVHDDGVGILPEVLPHVFDVFVQGPRAIDRAQGGLGLGLTIVRSLVALHGGEVSVSSAGPGKGSEFTVSLPERSDATPPADEVSATRNDSPAKEPGMRILLVDDNQDALDLLASLLREMGHEVHAADNAHDALELAERVHPNLGLLDIGLPEIDGYELARRLHALEGLAQLRLIALTGYGQASDRARSRDTGFSEHLVKPVTAQQIRRAIAEAGNAEPPAK
jgi:PAS domain S-box-containing protein